MKSHRHWLLLVACPLLGALPGCSDQPETKEPVVERSGVEKPASPKVERRANSETQVRPATNTDALLGAEEPDDELLQELEKASSDANAEGKIDDIAKTKADGKASSKSDTLEGSATKLIGQLANGQFVEATRHFDDAMKEAMPAEKLQQTWTTLMTQVGKLKNHGQGTQTKVNNNDVVSVTCMFERAPLDVIVSFNRDRQIAGLFFRPAKPAPRPKEPQTSTELKTKTGTLHGTIDLPDGDAPFPVVVIIAGSGPTDRDGNQPRMKNDSLKLLGAGLAAKGIAVLRYDKRGIGESAPAAGKEEDLRFETFINDAAAWVEQLRKDKRFSRVGIIGHSEGSLIGMVAARQVTVGAVVSIAGQGTGFSELLRKQLSKNLAQRPDLKKRSLEILDELVAGRTIEDVPRELAAVFRPSVQPYTISSFKYDPSKEIASLEMPVMIVQGITDIQVSVEDAKRLAAANRNARLCIINGMNHVMKHATTQSEQQAAYSDPSLPLVPEVLDEITAFVAGTLKE